MNIAIKSNVVNHLFITTPCPICHEKIEVSLGMLHRKEAGICPHCITPMALTMEDEYLDSFVFDFDKLYEQLQEYKLPLTLADKPTATILEID